LDNDWLLQQFTGRVDKNGIQIFEGDILMYKNMLYVCEYDEQEQCYIGISQKDDFKQRLSYFSDISIVGNVMETPKLTSK